MPGIGGGGAHQGLPGLGHQQALALHHFETRRHPGIEGKAAQHVLAEGMEGGDAQGMFGEQEGFQQMPGARAQRLPPSRGLPLRFRNQSQRIQGTVQSFVVQFQVAGEAFAQALFHLRRRLAGESHRQDVLGGRPRQQQAHQARHQQPGLAGTGRGPHRDVEPGIGGLEGGRGRLRHGRPASASGAGGFSPRSISRSIPRSISDSVPGSGAIQACLRHRPLMGQ